MNSSHTTSLFKGLLLALSLSVLAACQPGNLPPTISTPGKASGQPGQPNQPSSGQSASPVAGASGQPATDPRASAPPVPASSVSNLAGLNISSERTSFTAVGQQAQLKAVLLDAQGKTITASVEIEWASSRPQDFSIDATGLVKALNLGGKTEISARIKGTDLVARQSLSFSTATDASGGASGGSSGGSGGSSGGSSGGVGITPASTPSATESPTATPSDSPSDEPSDSPTATPAEGSEEASSTAEFRVNSETSDNQTHPTMAMDANGNFVVVWQSQGQDGDGEGIYGQRFNSAGEALGDEFHVNVVTNGEQKNPDVAMIADGMFVVTFQSEVIDEDGWGVYSRYFAADGSALGGLRQLNSTTAGDQSDPSAAVSHDYFVSTWTSENQDGSQDGIYARTALLNGSVSPTELRINQQTTGAQFASDVAVNADGNFVVPWTSHAQGDGESFDVYARRFDRSGNPLSDEFRVNTTTSSQEWLSQVALNDAGHFAIVWHSASTDGDGDGVYARVYDASGTAISGEIAVNTHTSGHQSHAAIAIDANGRFSIAWMSQNQDGDDSGIYFRHFDGEGDALSDEILANTTTAGAQTYPAIAFNALGTKLGISWASADQDGDGFGIFARLFYLNLAQ